MQWWFLLLSEIFSFWVLRTATIKRKLPSWDYELKLWILQHGVHLLPEIILLYVGITLKSEVDITIQLKDFNLWYIWRQFFIKWKFCIESLWYEILVSCFINRFPDFWEVCVFIYTCSLPNIKLNVYVTNVKHRYRILTGKCLWRICLCPSFVKWSKHRVWSHKNLINEITISTIPKATSSSPKISCKLVQM